VLLFPMAHLRSKPTPRAPVFSRQMARTCRKEKQSARTVRLFKRKAIKKIRREIREDFSRKRKVYVFCGDSDLEKL
jgi:hypothetical protein